MPDAFRPLVSTELPIVQVLPQADRVVLVARPKARESICPYCGDTSRRVHSHYTRRLADLPWQGRIVEIQLHARRFRCGNPECPRRIFTERLPDTVKPHARRTARLGTIQMAVGFTAGGEPGSRLAARLAMPVSGDTLLRMIRAATFEEPKALRVVGIDDWAWCKGQRYGTIVCDLERNRVLDLLPDRNAETVAAWLKQHPGVEIVARDRAGVYADGARSGAPDAIQVADRFHLLKNLGDALRLAVERHRKAVSAAGKAMTSEMAENGTAEPEQAAASASKDDDLRQSRREQRHQRYEEILRMRRAGLLPRQIAPRFVISKRTVERWLAAGGEPEYRRSVARPVLIDPFRAYLEDRWQQGERNGWQLWRELRERGFEGSKATVSRWVGARRKHRSRAPPPPSSERRVPSRRKCAWVLGQSPASLDDETGRFLHHLCEHAPRLAVAADLARRFATLLRGDDTTGLELWIDEAADSELASLANGIERDIDAVRAAIEQPWSTSPVEGQINRLKTLKRQMYGRAGYALLRSRVLMAA